AMGAGLMMGGVWSVAAFLLIPLGALADAYDVQTALLAGALLPAAATVFLVPVPETHAAREPVQGRSASRPAHLHWWSRTSVLTPPMEVKAEIIAMGGNEPPRGAPIIALSHVRGLRGGLGRLIGGRMCTGGAETRSGLHRWR